MAKAKSSSWGIIRYAAGSGIGCDNDCAAFDGWYSKRADALEVYKLWCSDHQNWIVAIVQADDIRFANADWSRLIRPHSLPEGTICPLKRAEQPTANQTKTTI